jgi:cytochrome c peroxidase
MVGIGSVYTLASDDGSVSALDDVVAYYDRGGNANPFLDSEVRPLGLTNVEKEALVAFLRTLSGHVTQEPSN